MEPEDFSQDVCPVIKMVVTGIILGVIVFIAGLLVGHLL